MPSNTATRSSRSRFAFVILVVAALALSLAACSSSSKGSSGGSGGSGSAQITVQDFQFTTKPVTAGAKVTVHNNGPSTHSVTADAGGFDVTINSGADATFTAPSKAGTYKFHCKFHSQMHGTLTVQ
jgi:plastocyanin